MGALKVKVGGSWIDIGGGSADEVWVGPDAPTSPDTELWYDTDALATSIPSPLQSFGPESGKPVAPNAPYRYFATDTRRLWMWDGTGWIVMAEPTQSWTPAITGTVIGTGGSAGASGWYKRGDGYCDISGNITLGSSGFSVAGSNTLVLPIASAGVRTNQLHLVAVQAGGWRYPLENDPTAPGTSGGLLYALKTDGTYLNNAATVNSGIPFAWAAGCQFEISGRYAMQTRYL